MVTRWLAVSLLLVALSGCLSGPDGEGDDAAAKAGGGGGGTASDGACPPKVSTEWAIASGDFMMGQPATVKAWQAVLAQEVDPLIPCQDAQGRWHHVIPFHVTSYDAVVLQVIDFTGSLEGWETRLHDPSGGVYLPMEGEPEGEVFMTETMHGGVWGDMFLVSLSDPKEGVWFVELVGDRQDLGVSAQMTVDSAYSLVAATEEYGVVGEPYVLEAAFMGPDGPVLDARVEAVIGGGWSHDGPPVLRLRDDGKGADEAARDGIYTVVFTPVSAGEPVFILEGFTDTLHRAAEEGILFMEPDDPYLPRNQE